LSHRLSHLLLRSQSDARLTSLARSGREHAFATLVERHHRAAAAYALSIVGPGRADDVVQDAFVRAWTLLTSGERIDYFRAWLFTAVHNGAMNVLRDGGRVAGEPSEAIPAGDFVDAAVERRLSAHEAVTQVAELPDRQRDAVVLTALQGHSGADAASILGVSEGTLHQLVHRARAAMRRHRSRRRPE
jgi:RNA polymerase sigma-70 factor (ECF subfamily)